MMLTTSIHSSSIKKTKIYTYCNIFIFFKTYRNTNFFHKVIIYKYNRIVTIRNMMNRLQLFQCKMHNIFALKKLQRMFKNVIIDVIITIKFFNIVNLSTKSTLKQLILNSFLNSKRFTVTFNKLLPILSCQAIIFNSPILCCLKDSYRISYIIF